MFCTHSKTLFEEKEILGYPTLEAYNYRPNWFSNTNLIFIKSSERALSDGVWFVYVASVLLVLLYIYIIVLITNGYLSF